MRIRGLLRCLAITAVQAAVLAPAADANHSVTDLLSTGPGGANDPSAAVFEGATTDGSVVFIRTGAQWSPLDMDSATDVYKRAGSTVTLVSGGAGWGNGNFDAQLASPAPPAGASHTARSFSTDGSVAVISTAEQLDPADTDASTSLYKVTGATVELVGGETLAGMSDDGERIFFHSGRHLLPGDEEAGLCGEDPDEGIPGHPCIDIYEWHDGTTRLVTPGTPQDMALGGLRSDGLRAYFDTSSSMTPDDTDGGYNDVYEYADGTLSLISAGPDQSGALQFAYMSDVSDDGDVFFWGTGFADDTEGARDVFQWSNGTITRISQGPLGGNGAVEASFAGVTRNGDHAYFVTREALVAEDTDSCFFPPSCPDLYERSGNTTRLISGAGPSNNESGIVWNGSTPTASHVYFTSNEPLVPQDTDTRFDLYERSAAGLALVSSAPLDQWNNEPRFGGVTDDAKRVLFETDEKLVAGDNDGTTDVYERAGGTIFLVSPNPVAGTSLWTRFRGMSADATQVFMQTQNRLVAADTDTADDAYVARVTGYARPKAATPHYLPLVPAYRSCSTPNRTHAPPLSFESCNPPTPWSTYLTIGVGDGNPALSRGVGSVRMRALSGASSDIGIDFSLTNVMRLSGLSDYTGELQLRTTTRLTDNRSPAPTSTGGAATTDTFDINFTVPCVATADTLMGGACTLNTTVNAVIPGAVAAAGRAIWAADGVRVFDGGPDEDVDTAPGNSLFMTQGVFVP